MKRLLTLLTFCLMAFWLQAQDIDLLDNIKDNNSKIESFEADLTNTTIKPKKTVSQEGKLYFVAPKEFAALFVTDNYMIVNEKKISMDIGLFNGTFRLKEGGIMRSLSNIFLYGFQGRIQDLADENDYSLSIQTKDGYHIITCTNNKKNLIGIGYKQVIFKFQTDSFLIKEIVLYDYSDVKDVYSISNVKYNVKVDPKKFVF